MMRMQFQDYIRKIKKEIRNWENSGKDPNLHLNLQSTRNLKNLRKGYLINYLINRLIAIRRKTHGKEIMKLDSIVSHL